jgi:hypothetical protein
MFKIDIRMMQSNQIIASLFLTCFDVLPGLVWVGLAWPGLAWAGLFGLTLALLDLA